MRKVHLIIISVFVAAFLLFGCAQIADEEVKGKTPEVADSFYKGSTNIEKVPVIVYTDNSQKDTHRILRKKGNAKSEVLIPDAIAYEGIGVPLSILPTDKNVNAFYDGKFVPLEIARKNREVTDYFKNQSYVLDKFLTNYKKQMIVSVNNEEKGTALYLYDFEKKTAKQLYDSKFFSFDSIAAFNEEKNTLFGFLAKGEGGTPVSFNLNTGKMKQVPRYGLDIGYSFSPNGKYLFIENNWSPDKCSMMGNVASTYYIIDPITGEKYGEFGQENKYVRIEAFSPDGKELMYSVGEPSSSAECYELNLKKTFYRILLDRPQKRTEVKSYKSVFAQWNSTDFVAEMASDRSEQVFSMDGKLLFSIPEDYQIIAAYYDN